jgi:NADH-quinone oxidoreductase subunit N
MSSLGYFDLLRLTLPQIAVALGAFLTLMLDLTVLRRKTLHTRFLAGALTACGGCVAGMLLLAYGSGQQILYDGMLVVNPLTRLIQMALVAFGLFAVLLSTSSSFTRHVGEYLSLILFATVAMMFLAGTQNLLLIFVSLEFLSLSLYILTGFNKRSRQSAEAALKYFLFGGMSAGFLLFGMSLLYGLTGSVNLTLIAAGVSGPALDPLLLVAVVMLVMGFGFKVAAAPFHLWAPDAYQGAPTPSAAFIASSSKIASFFVFAQVLILGMAGAAGSTGWRSSAPGWAAVIAVVAALSMLLGNLAAIAQTSVRRLLAYSAIGHAGYMLLGIAAHTRQSLEALIYYVITYALAAMGAFGVLAALESEGVDELPSLSGLSRRAPALSFCMLIFLLSLAGIPPLAGFFGKFYIFVEAFRTGSGELLWLVMLAIATSAVSLYYYLRVLKQIYVVQPVENAAARIHSPFLHRAVLCLIAALVVLLGCAPHLLLQWIGRAMQ